MGTISSSQEPNGATEVSFKDLILKIRLFVIYLLKKWKIILLTALLGGGVTLLYNVFNEPTYTAVCTLVLEDSGRGGALGQYAGLASLAGIDLGSGMQNGIFQGDNIIELYKSRLMIEKALLTTVSVNNTQKTLIERYIDFNNLRPRWKEKDHLKNLNFLGNSENFNRKQDSIITEIVKLFNKKFLVVNKPDKKLNIIDVQFSSKDELFAKLFIETLVETVSDFYVSTKTKRSSQSVLILQKQADSIKRVLNESINGVAIALEAAPNANPSLTSLRVPSQKRQVDVQTSTAMYAEIVKNLEISKISLRQETPLIQVIDKPVLPLQNDKQGKLISFIIGSIFGGFAVIGYLFIVKIYQLLIRS